MVQTAKQTIEAELNCLLDYLLEPVTTLLIETGSARMRFRLSDVSVTSGTPDPCHVVIRNGRPSGNEFELDRQGFRLIHHQTDVADFLDDDEVRRVYYPEAEALVRPRPARGALSHSIMACASPRTRCARRKGTRPERKVDNDQTAWSGPQRVRELLPEEAETLLRCRVAIVQVWQPIHHPVESFPLALCDARSISEEDMMVCERRHPRSDWPVLYNHR